MSAWQRLQLSYCATWNWRLVLASVFGCGKVVSVVWQSTHWSFPLCTPAAILAPSTLMLSTSPDWSFAERPGDSWHSRQLFEVGMWARPICMVSGEGETAGAAVSAAVPRAGMTRSQSSTIVPASSATTKLVAPVFKQDLGGKRTGLSIQNVGSGAATATVVFQVGTTTYTYNNLSIPVGSSALLLNMADTSLYPLANWTGGVALPNGKLAAVTVTANQPIIGIANEAPLPGTLQDKVGS